MKQRNAEILLIIVIASRSISYLLSKIGLNGIPAFRITGNPLRPDDTYPAAALSPPPPAVDAPAMEGCRPLRDLPLRLHGL